MLQHGEKIRRAVRWISDKLQKSDLSQLPVFIHQAISNFDLNPKEAEELIQFYQRAKEIQN